MCSLIVFVERDFGLDVDLWFGLDLGLVLGTRSWDSIVGIDVRSDLDLISNATSSSIWYPLDLTLSSPQIQLLPIDTADSQLLL